MIYLIRHGQTQANVTGTLRGSEFDDELNEDGIAEAKAAANQIKGIKFDVCYCSPMKRTRQTCEIVYNGKVIYDERLLPRKYQGLAGKTAADAHRAGYWNRGKNLPVPGGESFMEFETRVFEFLDEVTKKHRGKNILLISHGSTALMIQGYFRGIPKDMEYKCYIVDNCEVLKFDKRQ